MQLIKKISDYAKQKNNSPIEKVTDKHKKTEQADLAICRMCGKSFPSVMLREGLCRECLKKLESINPQLEKLAPAKNKKVNSLNAEKQDKYANGSLLTTATSIMVCPWLINEPIAMCYLFLILSVAGLVLGIISVYISYRSNSDILKKSFGAVFFAGIVLLGVLLMFCYYMTSA